MGGKEWIALILAGGQGSRLGCLTRRLAKPAVPFGGKYRIIDFALSNCRNSGLDTVGVLTQYQPLALHRYLGTGSAWDLDRRGGGMFVLPPYARQQGAEWYKGTADAVWQNREFIDSQQPEYVLLLSGDHIYHMDYTRLLAFHKERQAEATLASLAVPWAEASRYGILTVDAAQRIERFTEKPAQPDSNVASMGVYLFNWPLLRHVLQQDSRDLASAHDFGRNILPRLLDAGRRLYAYPFAGYWKDVGTMESFWQAHMDLLGREPSLALHDPAWRTYSVNPVQPPQYLGGGAAVRRSLVSEGCRIEGTVEDSVLFPGVEVAAGAVVRQSVVMPYVRIGAGARLERAIVGRRSTVAAGALLGSPEEITVVEENSVVSAALPASRQVV